MALPIWYSSTYLKLSERGTITEEPNPHLQKNETIQCMISGTKLIFWTFIPVWCRSREKEHHPKRECALWVIFCWMGVVAFLLISHSLDWVDNNDMTMSLTNSWVLGVCHTFFPCGFLSRWQLKKNNRLFQLDQICFISLFVEMGAYHQKKIGYIATV